MGSFKVFLNNLRYIFRYNLKEMYLNSKDIHFALDHIRYEMPSDLENAKKIKVLNADDSLEFLCRSNASLARFGDGEISLMFGNDIPCQVFEEKLGEKLKKALTSFDDNLLIGIPNLFSSYEYANLCLKRHDRVFYGRYTPLLIPMLSKERVYSFAGFTFPYINVGCNGNEEYFDSYYEKFRQIWDKKDIVVVCGDRTFKEIQYNIYDNAKSIEYICAPTNNAFREYDEILSLIKTKEKDKIIILILGPTATALAYDLAQIGYQALDLGHLCKDYDAYKRKIESVEKNIVKFFNPE